MAGGDNASEGGNNGQPGDPPPPPLQQVAQSMAVVETVHNCKIPPFWKSSPEAWFYQVESAFSCNQVRADGTRYNLVVAALDSEVVEQLLDVLRAAPDTGKYAYLKTHILSRFSDTQEKRLRTLFNKLDVGNRTPSQLLRHMRALAGNNVGDEVLKVRWLDYLPVSTQKILRVLKDASLDDLAEAADQMADVLPQVSALGPGRGSRGASPHRGASSHRGASPHREAAASALATEIAGMRACMSQLLATMQQLLDAMKTHDNDQPRSGRRRSRGHSNTRSKSPTPGSSEYCYYYYRFGMDAQKCQQPCTWKGPAGN
ncbi:uncharacterized protein LOC131668650 [Phymastichus coffea]|uniref:uncharacterized protein LOC131668650 n=1 Tax=Phymastichus coffea TaxID=108790 RepID=UPI00273AB411|nr:uncharacterized protein LOC131668650 [Phymastichus coffea]